MSSVKYYFDAEEGTTREGKQMVFFRALWGSTHKMILIQ